MMKRFIPVIALALLFVSFSATAQLSNNGLLTDIATRYQSAASAWAAYIMGRATWLYWTLVVISLVWTGGMMLLRGGGLQEFFGEFVRFIMATGFFWWLLVMAPTFVPGIYQSMSTIGASASGLSADLRPSGIVDIGFAILNAVLDNSSLWDPIDTFMGFVIALVILGVLALVAVNMVVLLISGWVLGYAGIIYLGFGGSRWTSEMAIGFYKTVLGIGIQLMTMILLVGIGKTFIDDYYSRMAGGVELKEMAVLCVASLVLLVLVNKVPQLVSSIASSNVGMSGLGSYGAGSALAAAGVAGAAVGVGASMVASGAAHIAGAASAIKAAFSQSGSNDASGTMAKLGDEGGGGSAGGASTASTTPFAQAAGLSSASGGNNGHASSAGDSGQTAASSALLASAANDGSQVTVSGGQAGVDQTGDTPVSSADQSASARSDSLGGNSMAGRAAAALAQAGRNLASGAYDVAQQAVSSRMASFSEGASQTLGGKIASAINQRQAMARDGSGPTFTGNGISAGSEAADTTQLNPEVAAFAQRDRSA